MKNRHFLAKTALLTTLGLASSQGSVVLGSMGGYQYTLFGDTEKATYATALTNAAATGGFLARINSVAENTQLLTWLGSQGLTTTAPDGGGARYVWLGGSDSASEGTWKWANNNATFWQGGIAQGGLYTNWGSYTIIGEGTTNEPDNFLGSQNGLGFALDAWPVGPPGTPAPAGKWNDLSTNNLLPYVVMKAVPEPSVAALGLLGAFGMLRRRRP